MSRSHATASADLAFRLVEPGHPIVPLVGRLQYSCDDPYAIRMAFHVGTDAPVEWFVARELLAAGLKTREGKGDVRAWPSSGVSADPGAAHGPAAHPAAGYRPDDPVTGYEVLNLEIQSPLGHAHFEASAAAVEDFLGRSYKMVPAGEESSFIDLDAELADLLS